MKKLKIVSCRAIGKQPTLDFEVDNELHNFIGDGIVISNSHAASYSALTALCIFLREKHPLVFFKTLLKHAKHQGSSIEEITKIHAELKNYGIKLLPPSIVRGNIDFEIEGRNIVFGLGSIKSISEKTLESLRNFKCDGSNKFELFNSAKNAGLSINHISSLIYAGALDAARYGRSEAKLALEAQLWNIVCKSKRLPKIVMEHAEKFNYDLFLIMNHLKTATDSKGKPYMKLSQYENIQKDYFPHKEICKKNMENSKLAEFWYQRVLLGYSYSTNLYEVFKNKSYVRNLRSIEEVLNCDEGDIEFFGVVTETKSWTSKKGNKCLKLSLTDGESSIEAIVTSSEKRDKIQEIKDANDGFLPEEDSICHIVGTKKGESLFVNGIGIETTKIFTKYADLKKEKDAKEKEKLEPICK